jgi:hypothetical protein
MNKVKFALTLLSIAIIVGPLAGLLLVYRDNVVGLILPPQVKSMLSGKGSAGSQFSQDLSNFNSPQSGRQLQYNPDTGAISYPFNFTNPLTTQISFDQMSAEVVGVINGNNVTLGNVSVPATTIAPGANAIMNATGNLSKSAVSQLAAQNSGATNLSISLENVNVDVGGVKVHISQINNVGSIPTG